MQQRQKLAILVHPLSKPLPLPDECLMPNFDDFPTLRVSSSDKQSLSRKLRDDLACTGFKVVEHGATSSVLSALSRVDQLNQCPVGSLLLASRQLPECLL